MARDFQPFVAPRVVPGETPGTRVRLVSSEPGSADPFVACPKPHPRPASSSPGAAAPPPAPVVTVRREGDRVVGIRVECTCGEVIDLDCVY